MSRKYDFDKNTNSNAALHELFRRKRRQQKLELQRIFKLKEEETDDSEQQKAGTFKTN